MFWNLSKHILDVDRTRRDHQATDSESAQLTISRDKHHNQRGHL